MAIEASFSKYKKTNLKIYIFVCVILAIWFGYDGYFNKKFKEKHTDTKGTPDSTLAFNQKSPPFFIGAAVLLGAYLLTARKRKIIAEDNVLILPKQSITYESIEKINKTYFDSKGYFIITYKDPLGKENKLKISDRNYDKLPAILEHLVAKIT